MSIAAYASGSVARLGWPATEHYGEISCANAVNPQVFLSEFLEFLVTVSQSVNFLQCGEYTHVLLTNKQLIDQLRDLYARNVILASRDVRVDELPDDRPECHIRG